MDGAVMSNDSTPDRETFQQILAGAYAVQASQIDRHSLAAYVEIQRLVAGAEIDATEALNRIVASTRNVAGAAGVAIGLLQTDHLIYRAGNGSAAADLNHKLTASLTASSDAIANREILRVENADEDPRIQAAICRQLGAKSVLILPICQQSDVVGLLEVRFSEPHVFEEPELRTYRLMAALIEETVFHAAQIEQLVERRDEQSADQKPDDFATLTVLPHDAEPEAILQTASFLNYASITRAGTAIYQRCGAALANVRESHVLRQSASRVATLTTNLATVVTRRAKGLARYGLTRFHRARFNLSTFNLTTFDLPRYDLAKYKNFIGPTSRRNLTIAGGLAVLGLTSSIAYWAGHKNRAPVTSATSPSLTGAIPAEKQATLEDPKPPAGTGTTAHLSTAVRERGAKTLSTEGRRVRVSENEVDYTRGDVTVRYFTTKPAPRPSSGSARKKRVTHIGEDVTVRYFAPESVARPTVR
jgi:hypothetical protein